MLSFTVGRGDKADVKLNVDSISRIHIKVSLLSDRICHIEDLGSSNGTFIIRGSRKFPVTQEQADINDVLVLGDFQTTVSALISSYKDQSGLQEPAAGARRPDKSSDGEPYSRYVRSEDGRYVRKTK